MYTLITKEIDGLNIVLGIDTEKIDQIATMKKIKPFIENTKEFKAKTARLEKIKIKTCANGSLNRQARNIINRASIRVGKPPADIIHKDLTSGELESINKYNFLKNSNNEEIKKIYEEMPKVNGALKIKKDNLIKQHGIYFNLKSEYENRISDAEAIEYKNKLKQIGDKKQFLLVDKSIIDDNRNKIFYAKIDDNWEKLEIKFLSDIVDLGIYKLIEDLTTEEKLEMSEHLENDRISNLSNEEKEIEKNACFDHLVSQAGKIKSRLEISGDSEALLKAQTYYNEQKIIIENKYK